MKKLIFLITILVIGVGVFGLMNREVPQSTKKMRITTSIYPMYFFTKVIVGDLMEVVNLTPAGVEPHDYEPTPQDLVAIKESSLLVINGGLETWFEKLKSILGESGPKILEASKDIKTKTDPHVWLSPILSAQVVDRIAESVITVDAEHKDIYLANASRLKGKLITLDKELREGLSDCGKKEFVTAHEAFEYLASEYGLTQVGITGISPDEEPSIKRLSEIAEMVKEKNIKVIFFESLVSPKLSQTLARETGAITLVLDPVEGLTAERVERGDDYFSVMRQNLVNLKEALICQ